MDMSLIFQGLQFLDELSKRKFTHFLQTSSVQTFSLKYVIICSYFYGEISLVDPNGEYYVYVIEEIKLLSKLFHQSRKLFHNIVEVVHNAAGTDPSAIQETQFNAVVTRGGSLLSFLIMSNQNDADSLVPMPVVVLTTHHNSYITPGQPQVIIDELGQMKFGEWC